MLFYRSKASNSGRGLSLATVRALVGVALAAYPAGGLVLALGLDGRGGMVPFEIAGFGLILVSLLAAAPVLGSHFQRIVGEQVRLLDEFELQMRHKAMSAAYGAFTVLALLATIYAAMATDKGWWMPSRYDQYNALFWGIFLYATLLPTACLIWSLDASDEAEPDNGTGR